MLGFQAKPVATLVRDAALPFDTAIKKIARVDLNSWLICKHAHDASATRLVNYGCFRQLATSRIQDKILVVAPGHSQVFIVVVYWFVYGICVYIMIVV